MTRWRSWCPAAAGCSYVDRERAIAEVVALLEVDAFKPEQVRVEWWLGDRWTFAPRATFRARARGREARQRRLLEQERLPRHVRAVRHT